MHERTNLFHLTRSAWRERRTRYSGILSLASILAAMLGSSQTSRPQGLLVTPGLGHDRFTETFFLEDSTSIDPDSLEQIKRTEEGLRESYVSLGLGLDHRRWRLESTTYATDAAWRNMSEAWGRVEAGRLRGDFRARLEWKGIDQDDSLASAYTYARVETKPRWRLNGRWALVGTADWEAGDYRGNTTYTVDYRRLRGQAGLEFVGGMLEFFDIRVGLARRTVPDSSLLEYTERFLHVGAAGWRTGDAFWTLDLSLADREFDPANAEDDHQRLWSSIGVDYSITERWRLEGTGEIQYWDYRDDGLVNYDFLNWRFGSGAHYRPNRAWEIGGEFETRLERTTSDAATESDYSQWRIGPRVNWAPVPAVWLEWTPRVGRRSYGGLAAYYDSYHFWELAAQGDFLIPAGPTASVLVSYLEEDHDDPANDLDQLFVSVVARFPIRP
jgi:hypothetical protein